MTDLPWKPFSVDGIAYTLGGMSPLSRTKSLALALDGTSTGPGYVKSSLNECVVAIGVFDGLHSGHQSLLAAARDDAARRGVAFVVVTFDPDPAEIVGAVGPSSRLLSTADRVAGLYEHGANEVVVMPFTPELARCLPEEFAESALCAGLRPVSVHVGSNFHFGYGGQGTPEVLRELGASLGFEVCSHDLLRAEGETVSATRIRSLLAEGGRLDDANRLLGRCHYVRGRVEHGRGEGTSFGFPTANVTTDARDCMPAEGVYACYVTCGDQSWPAAVNVGAPPTFLSSRQAFLEANLIGFEGDLYGSEVAVSFVHWLRPSRVFDSVEELERVVLDNISWVRNNL